METRLAIPAKPKKGLLLDIDRTLIDELATMASGIVVWIGGDPLLFRYCLTALLEQGLSFVGLASLRRGGDQVTATIELVLNGILDPQHIYFSPVQNGDKVAFALDAAAKKTGLAPKDLCLLEDQKYILSAAKKKNYRVVSSADFFTVRTSNLAFLQQQIMIIEKFMQIAKELELPPHPILAKLLLERKNFLAQVQFGICMFTQNTQGALVALQTMQETKAEMKPLELQPAEVKAAAEDKGSKKRKPEENKVEVGLPQAKKLKVTELSPGFFLATREEDQKPQSPQGTPSKALPAIFTS